MNFFQDTINQIDQITDKRLRGDYQQADYRKVLLPLTVLRRLDAVLEQTKKDVLDTYKDMEEPLSSMQMQRLYRKSKNNFYNVSPFTFQSLLDEPEHIADNFKKYIDGFSENIKEIFSHFSFDFQIDRLDKANLLYEVVSDFSRINLHPDVISNMDMGYVFEGLIRKHSENIEAGQHYTPREVIQLMIRLLFIEDLDRLKNDDGAVRKMYDGTCGTGGMLAEGQDYLKTLNPNINLHLFGQELNPETFAICKSDMLLKGMNPDNIKLGNTLAYDGLPNEKFDYCIANPPYGDDWSKAKKEVQEEFELGFDGRFGAGLPRTSDGSLLFLQHMVSKLKPEGGRLAIVLSGSPLFTGGAGSGESEIRKWVIENDLLECIIGLPNDLFYNTGINTYIWLLTNKKSEERKGKIQLIDGQNIFTRMRKNLGQKRNFITDEQIKEIADIHQGFIQNGRSKVFNNEDFGYARITVEQPLRLTYRITNDGIKRLKEHTTFINLASSKKKKEEERLNEIEEGKALQQSILEILEKMISSKSYKNTDEFETLIKKTFKEYNLSLKSTVLKVIMHVLSEKDETADVVLNNKGEIEVDTELRDYENVPLSHGYQNKAVLLNSINDYMRAEVLQHASQAWVDEDKTKIGYEIPFTRVFYQYTPLRSANEIRTLFENNEKELLGLMEGLFDETL